MLGRFTNKKGGGGYVVTKLFLIALFSYTSKNEGKMRVLFICLLALVILSFITYSRVSAAVTKGASANGASLAKGSPKGAGTKTSSGAKGSAKGSAKGASKAKGSAKGAAKGASGARKR